MSENSLEEYYENSYYASNQFNPKKNLYLKKLSKIK